MINYEDFAKVDLRTGIIEKVEDYPEARKPAYKVWVNLGEEIGIKQSSAQLTKYYKKTDLVGKKVVCVVNLPEKQIGTFKSQILICGVPDTEHQCVLLVPDNDNAVVGGKMF